MIKFVGLHSTICTGHRAEALPWPPLSPSLADKLDSNVLEIHQRVCACVHAMENDLTHATW